MLPITSITASVVTLGYLYLARRVILIRKREKISLGHGDNATLLSAIRAHANLTEYAPLALILMALLEVSPFSKMALMVLSGLFLLGRLVHAASLLKILPGLRFRVMGMALTLGTLAFMAIANVGLALVN